MAIVVLIIYANTGGGTYTAVQQIVFDNFGEETIGEIIDANLKNPEWSKEKLDSDSCLVYVEGYCPLYNENIRIRFYFEEDEDSCEVTLQGISFLDSGEEYSNAFDTAIVWGLFYE